MLYFFFQAEDGIRDVERSRGLGDVYKRQDYWGIYADEGISGVSTNKREQFKKMIKDCEDGKIDMVITKSISRFARNTQDCLP